MRLDQCYLILTYCRYWIQALFSITLTDMVWDDKDVFITCPRVDKKKNCASSLRYCIIILLFYSTFTPGGERQEENKEKEIHPLWDGEAQFWDKRKPPGALTPLCFCIHQEVSPKWFASGILALLNVFVPFPVSWLLIQTVDLSRWENILVTWMGGITKSIVMHEGTLVCVILVKNSKGCL